MEMVATMIKEIKYSKGKSIIKTKKKKKKKKNEIIYLF